MSAKQEEAGLNFDYNISQFTHSLIGVKQLQEKHK